MPDTVNDPENYVFQITGGLFGTEGSVLMYGRTGDMLKTFLPGLEAEGYETRKSRVFDPSDFAVSLLSDMEMETLNRFRSLKKQVEWVSGRFLLKMLARRFFGNETGLADISVAYHEQGAPFLPDLPFADISLSHSGDIAAAAAVPKETGSIGVDVERIGKVPGDNFLRTAFTQNELERMGNTAEEIYKNWTVKEAFLKLMKKGFNESLHSVEVLNGEVFYKNCRVPAQIRSEMVEGEYILTVLQGKVE